MTLRELLDSGDLRPHRTSAKEVADLLRVVGRDLADAGLAQLSDDRRFATAYNAALQLATIALHAAGYRAIGKRHHWAAFQAVPVVMGAEFQGRADYFDSCRAKRNVTNYDRAGEVLSTEVAEILKETRAFRTEVMAWLRAKHPALLPRGGR